MDGQGAVADYVLDDGTVTLWHHTALSTQVAVGDPVRVHEEHHGLEMEEFRP